ncbi:MAG: hypothetical protein ACJAXZ_000748 [Akkermansiaceae bacterium]|jgi:hypothetical protein
MEVVVAAVLFDKEAAWGGLRIAPGKDAASDKDFESAISVDIDGADD